MRLVLVAAIAFNIAPAFAADPPPSPSLLSCFYTANPSTLTDNSVGYMLCDNGHKLNVGAAAGGAPTVADPPTSPSLRGCWFAAAPATSTDGTVGPWLCTVKHNVVTGP